MDRNPPLRLFLYGTLRDPAANPVAAALHAKLLPGVPGWVEGRLHALLDPAGWYPALVPGPGVGRVHGLLCAAGPDFTAADLAAIDRYEEHDPDRPDASEYMRRSLPVVAAGEGLPQQAFAYCYNRPLAPDARPIPGGDFPAWLAASGLSAYAAPE